MNGQLPDLYAILQVDRTATREEIRRAYRRLLRTFHPDLQPAGGQDGDSRDRRRLQAVMEAYAVLGDPGRRAAYDRATAPPARPQPDPFLVDWLPAGSGTSWTFPSRESPFPGLREVLEYFLRRGFF
jgi:curved DNA-binding protein CbpA